MNLQDLFEYRLVILDLQAAGGSNGTSLGYSRLLTGSEPCVPENETISYLHYVAAASSSYKMVMEKSSGVIKTDEGKFRISIKGAAGVIHGMCSRTMANSLSDDATQSLEPGDMIKLDRPMSGTLGGHFVTIAYRGFDEWPPQSVSLTHNPGVFLSDLVFLGAFGIRDPLRPEDSELVVQCQTAGVFVRMVTGDNFLTAKAIAPMFRKLTPDQLDLVVPRLQVLARSDPEDKLLLVSHLNKMREMVAITGSCTNGALALKAGNVGFIMGISGTEIAREASAIVLMDDNFACTIKAIGWSRAINDATRRMDMIVYHSDAIGNLG
ncbi:HAD-like domain-containing protein [Dactylonectria macrodidyma]|uniref:HAD-like domain-containing protein n=1 Tax=Dactylonectria macrodidyma TaxID=307937 RepID=A0A9P9EV34_9HYPO|nr:HAD-like domain-containing protein [Dactylonectria macrodidyma]